MNNKGGFILAAVLFSPILVTEDVLREVGVNIPQKGIGYNNKGQSIGDIWNESEEEIAAEKVARETVANDALAAGEALDEL